MAFLILSLILWSYLKIKIRNDIINKLNLFVPLIFLILIFIQISIGAFVSGMDAGKIYNSWPLMGETYFPDDNNFSNLFELSAFSDPSLVQFIHRNMAYLIMLYYLFILILVYKNKVSVFYKTVGILGFIIILQMILVIYTVISGAHIYIAALHQLSSIFLVSSCIYFLYLNSKIN